MRCTCLLLMTVVMGMSLPARAFEQQHVPALSIQISLSRQVVTRDADISCPTSRLPSICRREFQLAIDSLATAESVLRVSTIAHPGHDVEAFRKHAWRLYEQGWSLYTSALAEYALPELSEAEIAEILDAQ